MIVRLGEADSRDAFFLPNPPPLLRGCVHRMGAAALCVYTAPSCCVSLFIKSSYWCLRCFLLLLLHLLSKNVETPGVWVEGPPITKF